MIEGARRCRLEGRGDARVGEPHVEGQQPAEQRTRRRLRQHISSAPPRSRFSILVVTGSWLPGRARRGLRGTFTTRPYNALLSALGHSLTLSRRC